MTKNFKLKAMVLAAIAGSVCSLNANAHNHHATAAQPNWKDVVEPTNFVLFEVGAAYFHAFYKDSITPAESHTVLTPAGVSIDPGSYYPNNFFGGYIEVSLLRDMMLYNVRYDMYGQKSKTNAGVTSKFAPEKLSFSVDKAWGDVNAFTYGLGAGVVVANINEGEVVSTSSRLIPNNRQYLTPVLGESIQGRTRIDPLVEVFAMYRLSESFNVRLNVAYQIPLNSKFTDGSINTNLGINYALPV